jgi:hypothetical protein
MRLKNRTTVKEEVYGKKEIWQCRPGSVRDVGYAAGKYHSKTTCFAGSRIFSGQMKV